MGGRAGGRRKMIVRPEEGTTEEDSTALPAAAGALPEFGKH